MHAVIAPVQGCGRNTGQWSNLSSSEIVKHHLHLSPADSADAALPLMTLRALGMLMHCCRKSCALHVHAPHHLIEHHHALAALHRPTRTTSYISNTSIASQAGASTVRPDAPGQLKVPLSENHQALHIGTPSTEPRNTRVNGNEERVQRLRDELQQSLRCVANSGRADCIWNQLHIVSRVAQRVWCRFHCPSSLSRSRCLMLRVSTSSSCARIRSHR